MFDDRNASALRETLQKVLSDLDVQDDVKFIFTFAEITPGKIVQKVIMSDDCGTCAGMMLDGALSTIIDGVKNGTLHVHALPTMYANSETIN